MANGRLRRHWAQSAQWTHVESYYDHTWSHYEGHMWRRMKSRIRSHVKTHIRTECTGIIGKNGDMESNKKSCKRFKILFLKINENIVGHSFIFLPSESSYSGMKNIKDYIFQKGLSFSKNIKYIAFY